MGVRSSVGVPGAPYGRRVDDLSEFKSIFEEALSLNRPSLIEVPMVDRQQELIDGIEWLRPGLLRTR